MPPAHIFILCSIIVAPFPNPDDISELTVLCPRVVAWDFKITASKTIASLLSLSGGGVGAQTIRFNLLF